ncbi:MAG: ChaN family lipoprotein [Candidatus Sulfobium sp.]|jgi:uncharacterized iron-regulated protein
MRVQVKFLIVLLGAFALFEMRAMKNSTPEHVYRLGDGKVISFERMVGDLKKARIVFVGEFHDDDLHHKWELEVIKALYTGGIPVTVGFEMFQARSQKDLDQWVDGKLPPGQFIQVYDRNWDMPWPLYRDIFFYLRDHRIPAIALNLPWSISTKVATLGFSSLTDKELAELPPGITCSVDQKYMDFIRRAYAAHGIPEKDFDHFCEAQILWDKTMAWHTVKYLEKHPDRTVIVLSGTGHAWKSGIPQQVKDLSEGIPYRVILPDVPGSIDPEHITKSDADYILMKN